MLLLPRPFTRRKKRLYRPTRAVFLGYIDLQPNGCWYLSSATSAYQAHRRAYTLFHGAVPLGLDVCHSCDDGRCCNPFHLWLGTRKENVLDAKKKGRLFRTLETKEILRMKSTGRMQTEKSKLKISLGNIGKVRTAEARAKMRSAKLGKSRAPMLAETKEKLSLLARRRPRKQHTEETKEKMRLARRAYWEERNSFSL